MAFHVACWESATGRTANRKFPAKYAGRCETCGNMIHVGDMMTWNKRGGAPRAGSAGTAPNVEANAPEFSSSAEDPNPPNGDASTPPTASKPTGVAAFFDIEALTALMGPQIRAYLESEGFAAGSGGTETVIQVQQVEVKRPDGSTYDAGLQHKQFPRLLAACAARTNVWIAGPAGSGKTTAGENAAKALGLPFAFTGALADTIQIFGYKDAGGAYHRTQFRECYEHGGVFMFDDFDASDPQAVIGLNAPLANGVCAFPDGMVKRHPDCVIILSANTWGLGATNEYVGRVRQDAAFLDRFVRLSWSYDEDLELATAPNMQWAKRVQQVRKAVTAKGLRVLVTPRATYAGSRLLAAGLSQEEVEEMTLAAAMTPDQWASVKDAA